MQRPKIQFYAETPVQNEPNFFKIYAQQIAVHPLTKAKKVIELLMIQPKALIKIINVNEKT